jgi:signal transduction histidine kinase
LDRGRYCADADNGVRIRRENQPTVEECTRKSGTSCLTPRSAPLRLERATQEGRAALNSLRAATAQTNDLAEALRRVTKDDLIPSSMAVTFSVVGDAREMHPIVRDEIYRIGYEGIRNVCAHSGASRLEVELRYAHDLALRVSDMAQGSTRLSRTGEGRTLRTAGYAGARRSHRRQSNAREFFKLRDRN